MSKKSEMLLCEALIEKGLLTKEYLETILKEIDTKNETLASVLTRRGIVSEQELLNILAEKLKLPTLNLRGISIDKSVIEKVPLKVASYYKFMPVRLHDRILIIAVSFPMGIKTQDEIRTHLGCGIEMVLSCQSDILDMLRKYYGLAAETLEKIVFKAQREEPQALEAGVLEKIEDIEKLADDASVIKLVNQIILEAYRKRATDIHIEPYRKEMAVRYRIDGVLYDANIPPEIKHFLLPILSRIKIMSNLNIVERRLPQDGRALVKVQDKTLDLRISTMPTLYGESVVIRLLPTQMLFSLERLGLNPKELELFEGLIQKPYGIIFVTGPTGSGKTTTLYTCLSRLNTKERKIIAIEDPIEYELKGITQIQVMPEIGLDFSRALRSMLRHDPDIMMVGEVRDLETAEIAIRVALTGHLIFSTLHTNDAASGITRLIDIGLEPYLVASSIEAFIAQRLVRVICPHCKDEDSSFSHELKKQIAENLRLNSIDDVKLFRGKGCQGCDFTGFFDRTAIYEILTMDEAIKALILKRTSSDEIKKIAMKRGMLTLRQSGWQKVLAGITTPEEVMRVTPAEESVEGSRSQNIGFEDKKGIFPEDRRVFIRLNSKINLRYKVFKTQEELSKYGVMPENLTVTKDISAGGLLFVANEAIDVGSFLGVIIELPDDEKPIECVSRAVRVDEIEESKTYDVGICLLDITGGERARLNRYVETETGKK